jgi:hypothetical protein
VLRAKRAMERNGHGEATLTSALEHVLEASQRVILDRMDLLRLEAEEDIVNSLRGGSFAATGLVLVLGGWLFLMVLAVHLLDGVMSHAASLGLVASGHLILGGTLAGYGIRALRRIKLMRPDDDPDERVTDPTNRRTSNGGERYGLHRGEA